MNEACNEWLNRLRWLTDTAIVVFGDFAGLGDQFAKDPLVAAGLADPNTFSAPHDRLTAADVQAGVTVLAQIFAQLTPEQSAALYKLRATKSVAGR